MLTPTIRGKNLSGLFYLPALIGLLFYWAIALPHLAVVPLVYEDEPWQSSTAWKLASQGVFGSDLFAGANGMEHNYYGFMPLYPLALSPLFRVAGVGLWQSRFFSVACGALILALTCSLTQRIWRDWRRSALAIFFLLSVRWFAETPLHPTGILFLDATRLARYDVLVPVLGLAAFHLFFSAQHSTRALRHFFAGMLVGLAGLAHLYGLFLLPILCIVLAWNRGARWLKHSALLIGGTLLVWLPYALYVLPDLPEWRAQTQGYASRFDLLNPAWYWNNVTHELVRYAIGWHADAPLLLRAGFWFVVFCLPLGLWFLARLAFWHDRRPRLLFVSLFVLPISYGLWLELKFTNYLLLLAPFGAMLSGWTVITLWERTRQSARQKWATLALVLVLMTLLAEASTRLIHLNALAAATTPYAAWSEQLHTLIPRGARVLGLPKYGYESDFYDYRVLLAAFALPNPDPHPGPLALAAELDAQRPDFVLMDDAVRQFLAENQVTYGARFADWLAERHATLVGSIQDSGYGLVQVWKIGK